MQRIRVINLKLLTILNIVGTKATWKNEPDITISFITSRESQHSPKVSDNVNNTVTSPWF